MGSGFRLTTLWRFLATGSSVVTALLAFRLYDYYLGAGRWGLIQTAVIVVGLLPQFDGGFRLAINRRLLAGGVRAERRELVDFAQVFYSWAALVAGALGMILLAGYSLSQNARAAGTPLSFYLILGSLGAFTILSTAQSQLLVGLGRQQQLFLLNTLAAWLNLGVLWFAFRRGQTLWAFPLAQAISLALPTAVAWWLARLDLPGLRLFVLKLPAGFWKRFRELWREAAPAFGCQLVMLFLYASDAVVASFLVSAAGVDEVALGARLFTLLRLSLQSADEAIWPRLAAGSREAQRTSGDLVRINALLYGTVMAVAAVTLPVFADLYFHQIHPSSLVLWLFAARYLITGVASQPAYYLYGHGRFHDLTRHLGLELGVALILSWVFASRFGAAGVAGAFALATLVGVAVPLPWAYTEAVGIRPLLHFLSVWRRAAAAAALAAALAAVGVYLASTWLTVMFAGAGATLLTFMVFLGVAYVRASRHGKVDVRTLVSLL